MRCGSARTTRSTRSRTRRRRCRTPTATSTSHSSINCRSASGASGAGSWNSTVFDDSIRAEEGNPKFANCESDSVHLQDYGAKLVRFYEDSTFVSAAVAGGDPGYRLTVAELGEMVTCGVNLFGLDQ